MRTAKSVRVEFISKDILSEATREVRRRKLTKIGEVFSGDTAIWIFEPFKGPFYWSRDSWIDALRVSYASIGDASRFLGAKRVAWHPVEATLMRRQTLIASQINTAREALLIFPPPVHAREEKQAGFFLLSDDELVFCEKTTANQPSGEYTFNEDRSGPPSRAYLKIWESLTRIGRVPAPGDVTLDVGSAPGGWTYALARIGAKVFSIDGADLDPKVSGLPEVKFIRGDAFKLKPAQIDKIEWFFSDMICDPGRIPELIEPWLKLSPRPNFVVTLKFKGECDFDEIDALARIPGSRVVHLFHNKHELTWILA